ncbi:MAG TPA: ROK family protein, partial [Puia sp.]|nr:ROK family protein [Puia sp.]
MFKHTNNTNLRLGADIGGTHISAALIADGVLLPETYRRVAVDPNTDASTLLDDWAGLLNAVLYLASPEQVKGIGLAMPGPFDYPNGTSLIRGLNKYESLFGINIKEALRDRLTADLRDRVTTTDLRNHIDPRPDDIGQELPISFENDAACFGLGEARSGQATGYRKIIAITLGTGLGACFIDEKNIVTTGEGVPPNGYLYCIPFESGIAEDYLAARWLLSHYPAADVKEIAQKARVYKDQRAIAAFSQFGANLGRFLAPWIRAFNADALVIGGSIAQSYDLFGPAMQMEVPVVVSIHTEHMAIAGAASLVEEDKPTKPARKSLQPMLPKRVAPHADGPGSPPHAQNGNQDSQVAGASDAYHLYPFEPLGDGRIFSGYDALAQWIIGQKGIRIDGYAGIDWNLVRSRLCPALRKLGLRVLWYETQAFLKPPAEIEALVKPFLGQEGSVWGTKTTLSLSDLFTDDLRNWQPGAATAPHATRHSSTSSMLTATDTRTPPNTLIILAGTGAGLSHWNAPIVYFDLPKNELQYRMRAGSATNLGSTTTGPFAEMYKRSYFVDWIVLNKHRRAISDSI